MATCVCSKGMISIRYSSPSSVPYGTPSLSQVPDALKNSVPDHVKEKAREMARQELARRLEELDMKVGEAKGYVALLGAVESHIATLHDLLESAFANESPLPHTLMIGLKIWLRGKKSEYG